MSTDIVEVLGKQIVVPLVQANDSDTALKTTRALADGGLSLVEVVLRTDEALDCLAAICEQLPDVIAGAGTVLSVEQAERSMDRGARFVVSPGLDDGVVKACQARDIPVYPGVATASEIQHAANLGLKTLKFFPANINGGVPALKAYSSVFRDLRFMPTGGVSAKTLPDYLGVPAVLACGGSWLTPADAIAAGDYERVTALAEEARAISQSLRAG
jgi:2-dehydro-3-deoxyphosphogluconate aldolase/(4S)-4-hydroxy-2-oxoglutarate aldolase